MARTKTTRANPAPGAGVIFALRAIGLVLLVRWLHAMADMSWSTLTSMLSSPWACINLIFIFLLLALPGALARAERPRHPLPQWLRQALRLLALLGFVFAIWSVGMFVWLAGARRALHAVVASNGWLIAAPALYAAVVWICRPQPLWRTNIAARRFAIGRYALSLDVLTRTVVVWMESRKVGQYDARELSVRWPRGTVLPVQVAAASASTPQPAEPVEPAAQAAQAVLPERVPTPSSEPVGPATEATDPAVGLPAGAASYTEAHTEAHVETRTDADASEEAVLEPAAVPALVLPVAPASFEGVPALADIPRGRPFSWPKLEVLWNSPAAVGHNRKLVIRAPLVTEGDRVAARALDATLRQFS
ncbi:MAG: hypothetical protein GAK40_00963 [Burkholderia plantarii]|nr:MAG: hypothetical protein GAK40_00963 [Burkholderia plantarii]